MLNRAKYIDLKISLSHSSLNSGLVVIRRVRRMERAYEQGEWRTVDYRKRRTTKKTTLGHQSHKSHPEISTFFVSNIPDGTTSKQLWWECKSIGILADVFIPKKKDKNGGRFAFVRFKGVKNIESIEKALENIRIDGAKLSANIAKFDVNGNKIIKEAFNHDSGRKGSQSTQSVMPNNNYATFKEALTGGKDNSDKQIEVTTRDESRLMELCKGCSLIGEAKTIDILNELDKIMDQLAGSKIDMRYLGGFKVMLSFESGTEAREILDKDEAWKKIFNSLVMWNGQRVKMERIAWITLYGVPPQAWDTDVFLQIGNSIGRITFLCEADVYDADLSKKKIAVTVNADEKIQKNCVIKWKGDKYNVLLTDSGEDWLPDFMKYEYNPKPSYGKSSSESSPESGNVKTEAVQPVRKTKRQETQASTWGDVTLENVYSVNERPDSDFNEVHGQSQCHVTDARKEGGGSKNNLNLLGLFCNSDGPEKGKYTFGNSPNEVDSDPFGLHELIFNCGKPNNKKRKRKIKSPVNRDKSKKFFGVTETDGVKHVKRKKTSVPHQEAQIDSRQADTNVLQGSDSSASTPLDVSCESVDLNKTPKDNVQSEYTIGGNIND